jgi:hypothetical protein
MLRHPLSREVLCKERIELGLSGDHADIRGIALISGTSMSDADQLNLHLLLPLSPEMLVPQRLSE